MAEVGAAGHEEHGPDDEQPEQGERVVSDLEHALAGVAQENGGRADAGALPASDDGKQVLQ